MPPITTFAGGERGQWRIVRNEAVVGEPLAAADSLEIVDGEHSHPSDGSVWRLRGVPSYERYVNRQERVRLDELSPPLRRPHATSAALIPISKSPEWWDLPQDARRELFEEQSHHIATGLKYLPTVARRLYHGRDLGEPFDFLTWFEFPSASAADFEELVAVLRETREWTYVVREIDIRLIRKNHSK